MNKPVPDHRPLAVVVAGTAPSLSGAGMAQRCAYWVEELQTDHRVIVVLTDGVTPPVPAGIDVVDVSALIEPKLLWRTWLGRFLPVLALASPRFRLDWRVPSDDPAAWQAALAPLTSESGAARIITFRLDVHDVAEQVLRVCPAQTQVLDLDDVESRARWSVAGAAWRLGYVKRALHEASSGLQSWLVAPRLASKYDEILLASPRDASRFAVAGKPVNARLNRVNPPQSTTPPRACGPDDTIRLLFVGHLSFPPNEEAVRWAVTNLLPAMRALGKSVELTVVGKTPSHLVRHICQADPGVRLHPDAESLDEFYASAHVALAPLWAGGGTKIKVLEAIANQRPVAATRHAVRGLPLVSGRDYALVDDSPHEAAATIVTLAESSDLVEQMTASALAACAVEHIV